MEIQDALRAARLAQQPEYSFAQIAAIAGSSESSARRWEAGVSCPTGKQLMALRRGLPGFAAYLDTVDLEQVAS